MGRLPGDLWRSDRANPRHQVRLLLFARRRIGGKTACLPL